MSTSIIAGSVTIIHQGTENGCTQAYRCEIRDSFTHIYGLGYGNTEQEAYHEARVDFQDNAASYTRSGLKEAEADFERLQAQSPIAEAV